MKAVVFHKPKDMRVERVDDPRLEDPRDVILRVTSTAICGSDLHMYNGFFPQLKPLVMGHEFMGVVEEVGSGITNLRRGDRVVVPFPIACGGCFFCAQGLPVHCEKSNHKHYGPEGGLFDQKGGALFGYTDLYGGYSGGQAEYVRVPNADVGPRKVPDRFSDEQVLFLTDILPTGFSGVEWAGVRGGETVAIFGCGPVGLMAQKCAWVRGAKRVIGLDIEPYRLEMAVPMTCLTIFVRRLRRNRFAFSKPITKYGNCATLRRRHPGEADTKADWEHTLPAGGVRHSPGRGAQPHPAACEVHPEELASKVSAITILVRGSHALDFDLVRP